MIILIYDLEKKDFMNKFEYDSVKEFWILLKFKKLLNFKKIKNLSIFIKKKKEFKSGCCYRFFSKISKILYYITQIC